MKTYTFNDPELGTVHYRDRKRYLWLLAVVFPLIPFVGIALMAWTGRDWTAWVPLLGIYALIPLFDALFPKDASNPPEAVVPQLEADPYYRVLNHLTVPMHYLVLIGSAWFVAAWPGAILGGVIGIFLWRSRA